MYTVYMSYSMYLCICTFMISRGYIPITGATRQTGHGCDAGTAT